MPRIESPRPTRRLRALAFGAALAAFSHAAVGCGFENPSSIAALRGGLQLAYPEALYVGTAVWQAQLAGRLPRDPFAQQEDLSPEARGRLRLIKANGLLKQLAARLAGHGASPHPNLAIVLLGPVLWSRIETTNGAVSAAVHVAGPERGDVVVVTDIPVVEAIAGGSLGFAEALELGVVRLYGGSEAIAEARSWLVASARGS